MKKLPALFLAAAVWFAPAVLPAATFEGKVAMKISGYKDGPKDINFSLKEGFSRIDAEAGPGMAVAMIMDQAKQEMTVLIPMQRMYMVQPMNKLPAAATATAKDEVADGEVVKTGPGEKILGYDTVKYTSTDKGATTEMWVTDQLGAFMGMGPSGNPMGGGRRGPPGASGGGQGWEKALAGKNVFPLRVVTTKEGKESFRMEATSVEKTTLPADLFSTPADYQDLKAMMGGMRPPGGN